MARSFPGAACCADWFWLPARPDRHIYRLGTGSIVGAGGAWRRYSGQAAHAERPPFQCAGKINPGQPTAMLKDLPLSKVYQLLEPGPVVLLTTAHKGRANVMTMYWHMMVEFEPPLVACVVSNADYRDR